MLYALDDKGHLIGAKDAVAKQTYFCSGCKKAVYVKKGRIKNPHFAHYRQACDMFSEAETAIHLQGKKLLAQWLKDLGYQPQIEAYLTDLKQRPDLLIKRTKNMLALEYQCSPIGEKRYWQRTKGYWQKGLKVCWILGMKYRLHKYLTASVAKFINWHPAVGFYLLFLDVKLGRLELDYNIQTASFLPVYYQRAYFNNLQELRAFFCKAKPNKLTLNQQQRSYQILKLRQQLVRSKGLVHQIQTECYLQKIDCFQLLTSCLDEALSAPIYRTPLCFIRALIYLKPQFKKQILCKQCYFMPLITKKLKQKSFLWVDF